MRARAGLHAYLAFSRHFSSSRSCVSWEDELNSVQFPSSTLLIFIASWFTSNAISIFFNFMSLISICLNITHPCCSFFFSLFSSFRREFDFQIYYLAEKRMLIDSQLEWNDFHILSIHSKNGEGISLSALRRRELKLNDYRSNLARDLKKITRAQFGSLNKQ